MRSDPRRWGRRFRNGGDRGMVTAELAACLPVLVLILAAALTAVSVVGARVRLQDAAREAARASARGDPGAAHRLAAAAAPGAAISVSRSTGDVVATASARVHPLGGWLPSFTVTERAAAAVEPAGGSP
jgi:Flp pilus assembly protein TadG